MSKGMSRHLRQGQAWRGAEPPSAASAEPVRWRRGDCRVGSASRLAILRRMPYCGCSLATCLAKHSPRPVFVLQHAAVIVGRRCECSSSCPCGCSGSGCGNGGGSGSRSCSRSCSRCSISNTAPGGWHDTSAVNVNVLASKVTATQAHDCNAK